ATCRRRSRRTRDECVYFFFSSRRRHTRSKRDWSSDVSLPICTFASTTAMFRFYGQGVTIAYTWLPSRTPPERTVPPVRGRSKARSEERRVGKEWRAGWEAGRGE